MKKIKVGYLNDQDKIDLKLLKDSCNKNVLVMDCRNSGNNESGKILRLSAEILRLKEQVNTSYLLYNKMKSKAEYYEKEYNAFINKYYDNK